MDERTKNVELAKLAEQTERYEDMARYMKSVTEANAKLSSEERNLLSVAYKNVVGSRRSAWRITSNIQSKKKDGEKELASDYLAKIEKELNDICHEVLKLLEDHLVPQASKDSEDAEDGSEEKAKSTELSVFYLKMKGDYYRYLAEVAGTDARDKVVQDSYDAYDKAHQTAEKDMPPINAIRLGLALNFSVFHYEIKNEPDKACNMAKKAFDDAITELDQVKDDSYKDTTLILQLLRDNITLWTSDREGKDDEQDEQ